MCHFKLTGEQDISCQWSTVCIPTTIRLSQCSDGDQTSLDTVVLVFDNYNGRRWAPLKDHQYVRVSIACPCYKIHRPVVSRKERGGGKAKLAALK